jgi:hypothetical protein
MLNVPWMSLSFYPLKKKVFFFAWNGFQEMHLTKPGVPREPVKY